MITEREYTQKIELAHRKKYAQFFTPEFIADFMASWLLEGKMQEDHIDILEPAFGLGIFSRVILGLNANVHVDGYDIDHVIFQFATQNFKSSADKITLKNENYLTSAWDRKYDGIICNPPYLKFHDYDNASLVPLANDKLGTHLNGFTNIYSLFLLKSISQLKEGGRLAYIIPSEFLNSDYGVEVKRMLKESGTLRHVIIVDFTQCAFDDALTTACVLLCEKSPQSEKVSFANISNVKDIASFQKDCVSYRVCDLDPTIKWKQYYEVTETSKYSHLVPFSTFAKVSRGIATGANNYFTFKASKKDLYSLPEESFRPCICHAVDVPKLVFTKDDFEKLSLADKTVYLFNGCAIESNKKVDEYIQLGVENHINQRHLTANRKPWYALENRKPSPIWVSVFNRNGLRFVRNKALAYNLTTFHCVYNISEIDTDILFAYLITDMAKEIFLDNSRQYGNGLVKFEPNDLNKGMVVDFRCLSDKEKQFVLKVYRNLSLEGGAQQESIALLDDFFRKKYTSKDFRLEEFVDKLNRINSGIKRVSPRKRNTVTAKQLYFT